MLESRTKSIELDIAKDESILKLIDPLKVQIAYLLEELEKEKKFNKRVKEQKKRLAATMTDITNQLKAQTEIVLESIHTLEEFRDYLLIIDLENGEIPQSTKKDH